ncbi:hypothetical protein BDU57DRAFT_463988 [Ampelomyces quisqualis]|uniref:Uncharacterized protein n=1 Tax=Ampelomyces quisqualis TaxID=50730 RepID=A0A6A5R2P1_AMPQU|nr:hypothetical protein BDU57DRAFT_463988 [Ampelomyces quisqualis]
MFRTLPATLLVLLFALPPLCHASPSPAYVSTNDEISLIPRHTLFLRQLSNLQTFSQALGGKPASAITNSGDPARPFSVDSQTFDTFESAAQRSCDNQFQACESVANGIENGGGNQASKNQKSTPDINNNNNHSSINIGNRNQTVFGKRQDGGGLTVNQCDQQKAQCNDAQQRATVRNFQAAVASTNIGPDPLFPDFDLICEG